MHITSVRAVQAASARPGGVLRRAWLVLLLALSAPAVPAVAAPPARLTVVATRSATVTLRLARPLDLNPETVTVTGKGRLVALHLSGTGAARAGLLGHRYDPRSPWGDLMSLGPGQVLAAGTYRLTLVTDAPVEVSIALTRGPAVRVSPRAPASASLNWWYGTSAGGPDVRRVPVRVGGRSLVVVGGVQAARGATAVRTDACLTMSGSVCQAGGVRPLGSTSTDPGDVTSEVLTVYEPGEVTDGSYDAVVQTARLGGSGLAGGFVLDVQV